MADDNTAGGRQRSLPPRWAIGGLIVFTVVVRGTVLIGAGDSLSGDPDGYRLLAHHLVESGGTDYRDELDRTAYRPPLYPLLLAATGGHRADWTVTVALVHLALGFATVGLTAWLGWRWGLGNYSLVAAALVACDPILLHHSRLVMTETLATLLAVVMLHLLANAARRPTAMHIALAGVSIGLAALCRPVFLAVGIWAPVVLMAVWPEARVRLRGAAVFGLSLAATLLPWTAWTYSQLGVPVVTTTHGGYTLLLGNNPSFYEYLRNGRWGEVWEADAFQQDWQLATEQVRAADVDHPAAEVRADRAAYRQAWQNINRQPGMFFHGCLIRAGRFWGVMPHRLDEQESTTTRFMRWAIAIWYTAQFTLALAGIWWLRSRLLRSPWLWGIALVATFALVHTVYWSNLRMRAPAAPVVAMLAAAGLAGLARGSEKT